MSHPKKLIEVALPLEAINEASIREGYIYKKNPSAVHKWWAQRPLAACRAVIFAQMVDDPSSHPEMFPTSEQQDQKRQELFDIIKDMVKWENIDNEEILERARNEIRAYAPSEGPPPLFDPFAGGGSIPIEAQRLGLNVYASDLNPVAVLINKALVEIPPSFAGYAPVNPESKRMTVTAGKWKGVQGLGNDIMYYGSWVRDQALKKVGHLYPSVTVTPEILKNRSDLSNAGIKAGDEMQVIAWLWTRTVPSPNPAVQGASVPLIKSFALSTRKGRPIWLHPVINHDRLTYHFEVGPTRKTKQSSTLNRSGGICLFTGTAIPFEYIRNAGKEGQIGHRLMALAVETKNGRVYFPPVSEHEKIAASANPSWEPTSSMAENPRHMTPPLYGMKTFKDIFTSRQLEVLNAFTEMIQIVREQIVHDAQEYGEMTPDAAIEYANAVVVYLAFACDKYAMYGCSLVPWYSAEDRTSMLFGRQAISMVWDYTEVNPFTEIGGSFIRCVSIIADAMVNIPALASAVVEQKDAALGQDIGKVVVSTDPPYYDNVPYADLSDFFYVWLRRMLGNIYPQLFSTLLTPKTPEIVADPYRHGNNDAAEHHFLAGINKAFSQIRACVHPNYPVTIYYAFRQAEQNRTDSQEPSLASTGWETMLEGLIRSGFAVTGTWPIRTERSGRLRDSGSNALASSVVLVCRIRPDGAPLATRRDFLSALQNELPAALRDLQRGNIAPVDLAQAAIGPGMAIYSRYPRVIEADGSSMRVRTALALINQALDEYLSEQEGEFDADTRWALAWFEQFAFDEAEYGLAETLSKAKNTSVTGMVEAGILHARAGKVRLLRREELAADWNPATDRRPTVWEATQHLIRRMQEKGELAAADLLAQMGPLSGPARDLAYRLYTLCERKGWASEALPYNALVVAWSDVGRMAGERRDAGPVQGRLV